MLQSDTTRLAFAIQREFVLPFVTCVASFLMQETSKDTRMNNLKQRINDDMKLQSRSTGETSHCAWRHLQLAWQVDTQSAQHIGYKFVVQHADEDVETI